MTCGVYKLINKTNGKIYIGSAIDINLRWRQHRNNPSSLIGRALKKYGIEGFTWEIVEEAKPELLLEREQYYLDTIQPFGDSGYNIARIAGNTLGIPCSDETKAKIRKKNTGRYVGEKSVKSKTTTFMSPDGELIMFPSISIGSKERGLHVSCMAEVARGKRKQYKGWTCPDGPEWIPAPRCSHVVLDPKGNEYHVTNIKDFCKEHKLSIGAFRMMLSSGQAQHKGWRLPGTDVKTFHLRDPNGEKHTVFEIKSFAEDNNLSYTAMRAVVCGNQKQHKGWMICE